jgi:hypothetical protein
LFSILGGKKDVEREKQDRWRPEDGTNPWRHVSGAASKALIAGADRQFAMLVAILFPFHRLHANV